MLESVDQLASIKENCSFESYFILFDKFSDQYKSLLIKHHDIQLKNDLHPSTIGQAVEKIWLERLKMVFTEISTKKWGKERAQNTQH